MNPYRLIPQRELPASHWAAALEFPGHYVAGDDLPSLPFLGKVCRSMACDAGLLNEIRWHVEEVRFLTLKRNRYLRLPVVAYFLRDQHEVNRLLWVAHELLFKLSIHLEEAVRVSLCRMTGKSKAAWVEAYCLSGRSLAQSRKMGTEMKSLWERGRAGRVRTHSAARQDTINTCIHKAIAELCAATGRILKLFRGAMEEEAHVPVSRMTQLEQWQTSALWHCREVDALLSLMRKQSAFMRVIRDSQRRLNLHYWQAMRDASHLLEGLCEGLGLTKAANLLNGKEAPS